MAAIERRILAVSWTMPPLLLPRALQISRLFKQWASRGWETTVLTVNPASLGKSLLLDPVLENFYRSSYTAVPVDSPERSVFLRVLFRLFPWFREMPDEKRWWARNAVQKGQALAAQRPYSAIISFAQPWSSHVAGLALHQLTRLPWIAHFSDPWTAGAHAARTGSPARQAREWEARIVNTASRLVFVSQEAADATMEKYPPAVKRKVRMVPHGYDVSLLHALSPSAPAERSQLTLVHSGNFYGARMPWAFLDALEQMQRSAPLALNVRFIGYVPRNFAAELRRRDLAEVVTCEGPRPYFEALRSLRDADALLLIEAAGDNHLYFPSKLVDYLLFQKPILGLTPSKGPSGSLLRELQCPTADPDDVAGIQRALQGLLALHAAGNLKVSDTFAKSADAYDIRRTADLFQDLVEEVIHEAS